MKNVRNRKLISSIVAIVFAVLVMAACFFINMENAWMGFWANLGHMIATIFFIVFWSGFVLISRRSETLRKAALIISLLVCVSSVCSFIFHRMECGFLLMIVAILTSMLSYTLFYGFSYFFHFGALEKVRILLKNGSGSIIDIIAVAISVLWLVFAIRNVVQASRKKKMRESMYGRSR